MRGVQFACSACVASRPSHRFKSHCAMRIRLRNIVVRAAVQLPTGAAGDLKSISAHKQQSLLTAFGNVQAQFWGLFPRGSNCSDLFYLLGVVTNLSRWVCASICPKPPRPVAALCIHSSPRLTIAAAAMELRVGRKYRLGRKIGSGSFGGAFACSMTARLGVKAPSAR